MKKMFRIIIASILVFTLLFSSTESVSATSLGITPVTQAYSNWCWAACAEMVGKVEYTSSQQSQYTVVTLIKGNGYPNVGGTAYETASACSIVTHSTKNFGVYSTYYTPNQITSTINNGHPLIGITGVLYNLQNNTLHDIAIYGYEIISSVYYVRFVEPESGQRMIKSWDSLTNGTWLTGTNLPYSATITSSN